MFCSSKSLSFWKFDMLQDISLTEAQKRTLPWPNIDVKAFFKMKESGCWAIVLDRLEPNNWSGKK